MGKIVNIKDLERNISGIYKINYPNGKCYIGLSVDIKRRIWEHNSPTKAKMPCDLAIQKYGKIEEIEILEICAEDKLNERERYWINYYDSTNRDRGYNLTKGGDSSGLIGETNLKSVFTNEQVLDIRKRRFQGERKKDVYADYLDKSFSSFEHIWLGRGYTNIGKEYIIPTNSISRQEYSSKANIGVKNGRAKFTEGEIKDIRSMFDNGIKIKDIHDKYNTVSRSTISRIAHRQVYKDIA